VNDSAVQPLRWEGGALVLLDQRRLPQEEAYLHIQHEDGVATAIRDMAVRGAPAIGVAAGSIVSNYVSEKTLQYVAGIGFIGIGIWTLVKA